MTAALLVLTVLFHLQSTHTARRYARHDVDAGYAICSLLDEIEASWSGYAALPLSVAVMQVNTTFTRPHLLHSTDCGFQPWAV